MEAKDLYQISKQLYAMEQKRRKVDLSDSLRNERYQRTFTDEYLFGRKSQPREPVQPDPSWELLATK